MHQILYSVLLHVSRPFNKEVIHVLNVGTVQRYNT